MKQTERRFSFCFVSHNRWQTNFLIVEIRLVKLRRCESKAYYFLLHRKLNPSRHEFVVIFRHFNISLEDNFFTWLFYVSIEFLNICARKITIRYLVINLDSKIFGCGSGKFLLSKSTFSGVCSLTHRSFVTLTYWNLAYTWK